MDQQSIHITDNETILTLKLSLYYGPCHDNTKFLHNQNYTRRSAVP